MFILCFQLLTSSSRLYHCMVSIYFENFVKCVKPYHHFTTSRLSFNRRMCGARAPLRWKRVTHATHYLSIIVLGFSFNSFYTYHSVFTGIRRNVAVWRHTRMHACSMCMLRRICNLTLRAHIFFRYRISIFDSNISELQVSCILNLKQIKTFSLVIEYTVQYFWIFFLNKII